MIDWCRVARPQEDQYDTQVALRLIETNKLASFRVFRPPTKPAARTIFDGRVRIEHVHSDVPYDDFRNGPLDVPAFDQAESRLRLWPCVHRQFPELIACVHPMQPPPHVEYPDWFSSSGSHESEFGVIYATVDHSVTLAEAMVHEMAHNKLFALGIGVEQAARLITNRPDELYVSPVIKDRLRPLTAVFHAEYTFTHIVYLDLLMLAATSDEREREALPCLLEHSLTAIEEGFDVVRANVKTDTEGRRFVDGFLRWAEAVIDEAGRAVQSARGNGSSL